MNMDKGVGPMIPVYKRLHMYMVRNDIRQKTVSADAGMTQAKLSQLLNGRRRMTVDDYLLICQALNRDPRFFMAPEKAGQGG